MSQLDLQHGLNYKKDEAILMAEHKQNSIKQWINKGELVIYDQQLFVDTCFCIRYGIVADSLRSTPEFSVNH